MVNNRKSQGWNIICSPISISISHYLQIQQAEASFSACHQGINDIFSLKSFTVCSFSDCQKHDDITMRWRDEYITVSSFSQYYTWHNDLHLYNMILVIIMFNYLGIVVIWDPWFWFSTLQCHLCLMLHVRHKWHWYFFNDSSSNDTSSMILEIPTWISVFQCFHIIL